MKYDITKWHLFPGDICWYINKRGEVVKATVYARDFWRDDQENDPHFIKRYWIEPHNVRWYHKAWDRIRLFYYRYIRKKGAWFPNWRYPGHAVDLGDEIFLTEHEADLAKRLEMISLEVE